MSDLVKRQHFVPRTYLKHFCEDSKQSTIFVLPKESNNGKDIFSSNTQNVALKKHLYTMPEKTVEQRMAIEKLYSDELEVHYNKVYRILVDPSKDELTSSERELIISTVVTMYYRTTIWFNMQDELNDRTFEVVFQMAKNSGKDFFIYEDKKISMKGKTLEGFSKEYNKESRPSMALTQLEAAIQLIKLRVKNDGILVSKLSNEKDLFITSDNPVIVSNENKNPHPKPLDPTNILKLPLDKKHILYLLPYGEKDTLNKIFRSNLVGEQSSLERLSCNYKQMINADKFAFGTKKSLEDYIKIKANSERNLSDAEFKDHDSLNKVLDMAKKNNIL